MHLDFLESAEFYNRRYHNFSSRVIFPMSLLVVFTFGFAMFAEKEISLSSKATVEPSRIIANISRFMFFSKSFYTSSIAYPCIFFKKIIVFRKDVMREI